jgi:hypothetical protein
MLFKPDIEKLQRKRAIPGLVRVVCGSDEDRATKAAPILGALLLKEWRDEAARRAVTDLARNGEGAATAALLHVLTAEKGGWFKLKSDVALALYELERTAELRDALEAMDPHETLRQTLSPDLLTRAIDHDDAGFVEYLLVNGSWSYPSDVRPGWDFLIVTKGPEAVARLLDDSRLWFIYNGERRYTISGEQGRLVLKFPP